MQQSFTPSPENPILFFDGVCGLCDGFVDFVISRDKPARFRFATLQGETFSALSAKLGLEGPPALAESGAGESNAGDPAADAGAWMRSMVLYDGTSLHRKSDGALRVMQGLGGLWVFTSIFRLVPSFIRDLVYDFIARNRYRWFGKKETCRLPTPAERARFLP